MSTNSSSFPSPSGSLLNPLSAELAGIDLTNLYPVIDKNNVYGLNATIPESVKVVIKPWDEREDEERYVESNVDDQLMIHVPFMENVRIKSMLLKVGRGDLAPRHVKIYNNHPNILDFSDAETLQPQLDLSLLEGESGVVEYPLRVTAFTSVHSLSLLFANPDTPSTRIYFIGFRGDMRSAKREVSSKLHVPAPTAADAPLNARAETKPSWPPTAR